MRKSAIFAAAFVLTLGLAQCKKEQPNAQISEGETVHITVKVNNNGSRADIQTPSTGHYVFEDGDKLYVGYNGAYAGALDYSASASIFSGDITISQSGSQRLHFYYLGGSLTPTVNGSEYTVDISDQRENYPVISYGTSNVDYAGAGIYTTTLLNQCALVEFTTNEIPTTTAVSISGMKNKVTVDFNGNTLTPSEERGTITLHNTESTTKRWAILLADNKVTTTATAEGYEESESFTVPAVAINAYLHNETAISFTLTEAAATIINLAEVTSNTNVEDGAILTGTLANNVQISIADGATVTLDGVNITNLGNNCDWAGINCPGDATIILKDGSTNTVCAGRNGDGFNNYPGIWIAPDKKLTIKGGGQLTAYSNNTEPAGAGIGGGFRMACGSIEIQGGVITATGGFGAAGIGSGYMEASCDAITITNGVTKVTATKGETPDELDDYYCIGAGYYGSCGTVTIGGVVGAISESPYTYEP